MSSQNALVPNGLVLEKKYEDKNRIVSVHCPLTEETYALIGQRRLALMKPSAVLINIARGEIVDEQALANALGENRIAGAAVDVFSEEPLSKDNPLMQVQSDNLILTPHLAGTTNESKVRIISTAIGNIAKVLSGERPDFIVNLNVAKNPSA